MNLLDVLPKGLQGKILDMLPPESQSAATAATETSSDEWQPYLEPQPTRARFTPSAAAYALSTRGVAVFDSLMGEDAAGDAQQVAEAMYNGGRLRPAGMGKGETAWSDSRARGDELLWMTDDELQEDGIGAACKRMYDVSEQLWREICPGEGLEKTSFQLARYPGEGAKYVRHTDVSERCPNRRITAIYYMNRGWQPSDGGALRIHQGEGKVGDKYTDIAPIGDRLVLFLSDMLHEVMPSHAPRLALSGWLYASSEARPLLAMMPRRTIQDTIFVSVPAYRFEARSPPPMKEILAIDAVLAVDTHTLNRDEEAHKTIQDLFDKASRPDLLYVGLIAQADPDEDVGCFPDYGQGFTSAHASQVREVRLHWCRARGPCYARYLAQRLYKGERYYLQIDSHMRFARGWDDTLISELSACPSQRPVLSSYPPGYERGTDAGLLPENAPPTIMIATRFGEEGMLRVAGRELRSTPQGPVEGLFWAAGFSFSSASLITEVPYDPSLDFLFFGEESVMQARLFTSGYDLFSPSKAVAFHHWSRTYRPSFFSDVPDTLGQKHFSLARARAILGMPPSPHSAPSRTGDAPRGNCSAPSRPGDAPHGNCSAPSRPGDAPHANRELPRGWDRTLHINTDALCEDLREGANAVSSHKCGLGNQRTLREWYAFCGVDFERGVIEERARRGGAVKGSLHHER